MTCIHSDGMGGTERVSLSAEGFGSRICSVEGVSDRVITRKMSVFLYISSLQNFPPDMSICSFFIHQALSIRALQEMMKIRDEEKVS